ncbi:hypothetical protein E4U55_004286 [Claviceps digitariae]|nr:hypothetical protein E4U55_004286 [Claviceps digitariae]
MSADTRPISPSRFAAALQDLSLSMLHLKVLEIRNSIAHLQYSNDQLKPFADGTATPLGNGGAAEEEANSQPQPDQDCIDAMRENEVVMARMAERIALVRAEVEGRGVSWAEFRSQEEVEEAEAEAEKARAQRAESPQRNGHGDGEQHAGGVTEEVHSAWRDGTFQTGRIRNGEVHVDDRSAASQAGTGTSGGRVRLSDEELRRAVEERMRNLVNDEEEGGMHL